MHKFTHSQEMQNMGFYRHWLDTDSTEGQSAHSSVFTTVTMVEQYLP